MLYPEIKNSREDEKMSTKEREFTLCKARITKAEWEKFKKAVHPVPAQDALGIMMKQAIQAHSKPFGKLIEEIMRQGFEALHGKAPS